MGLLKSFAGMVTVELTSADIPGFLSALNQSAVPVFRVKQIGYLSVQLQIYRADYRSLNRIAGKRGEKIKVLHKHGFYWSVKNALQRPVLICGMLFLLGIAAFLPTRVLFVEVDGNINIPDRLILEKAAQCGIVFGSSRRDVRSEQMKNNLLSVLPQLQWAGINTYGCTAIISVTERSALDTVKTKHGVSSIVASVDGIIQSCTVTRGNALCKIGQAVKAGEVLVSGYTDCGMRIQATRAEAEIFAQTIRHITVVTPTNYRKKEEQTHTKKKYSLIFGKNRINFYKDSGISDTTCDKMYMEYYVTLPGGFQLPLAIAVEQWTVYDYDIASVAAEAAQESIILFVEDYLDSQMISGQILTREESVEQTEDTYRLYGKYGCLEMIGRSHNEEIIDSNGKNN